MAQTNFNVGAIANDGTGDALRDAFIAQQAMNTDLYTNKVDKVVGKDLSENDFTDALKDKLDNLDANAEENVQADWLQDDDTQDDYIKNKPDQLFASVGYFHYNDVATQTTPISVTAYTETLLTNDTEGSQTNRSQAPYGVSDVWFPSAFDFSQLSIGDTIDLRVDLLLTTDSVNQKYKIFLRVGETSDYEYDLHIFDGQIKEISTDENIVGFCGFSLDYEEHLTNLSRLYIVSDDDARVKVNGWYTRIVRKSINVIDFNSDPLKLDKDTTAGVERAYIINADGSQGTKATSDFGGVLEFANLAAFPATGEVEKIYIDLATNMQYRWSGSAYVKIGGGKRYQTFLFQSSATVTLPADQKNLHQSRFTAGASVLSTLGLTLGSGISEPGGVLDLNHISDVCVPNITPNYISKVVNVTLSYSRNVAESGANTNVKIILISDTKYNTDIQKICEHVITSSTLLTNNEGKVTIPILTHLPLSAFSNLKWTIRSNNGVAQQFNILRLNVDIEEI